jgi:acyl dehydratase
LTPTYIGAILTQQQAAIDELRGKIGVEERVVEAEVDKSIIRRFVQAVDDPNPLWQNEEYAKKSKYGGIVAPPEFLCASFMSGGGIRPEVSLPFPRTVDGGGEFEFYLPIRPGDKITACTKFVHLKEKDGKSGKMLFLSFETVHKNQRSEIVAKSRATIINME